MKFISLNVEQDKHLEHILPFLRAEQPEVLCLQEALAKDLPLFEKGLGMHSAYEPLVLWNTAEGWDPWGIALLSKYPLQAVRKDYYRGAPDRTLERNDEHPELKKRLVLSAEIESGGRRYRIGNTHFTWTPDGNPSGLQHEDLPKLLAILGQFPDIMFAGDFNAPRGGEIFGALAGRYTDWVPEQYATSIDGALHRAGPLPFMVDGLFSTAHYRAEHVRLVSGVSDHMAVVADIVRVS